MASQINKFIGSELYKTNHGDWTNRHWLLTSAFWKRYKVFKRKTKELEVTVIHADELMSLLSEVEFEFELARLDKVNLTITDYDMAYQCIQYKLQKKDRLTLRLLGMDTEKVSRFRICDFQCVYIDYLYRITKGRLRIAALCVDNGRKLLDMFKLYDGDEYIGLITRVL